MHALNITMTRSRLGLVAVSGLIFGLAACGGGGSSGTGTGGGSVLPTAPVTITQTNTPKVAGAAVNTIAKSTSLPFAVQTTALTPAPSAVSNAQMLADIGIASAQKIFSQGAAPAIVTGAATTTTINCTVSGTESGPSAAPTTATPGVITFTNCSNVAGITINGTLSVSNWVATPFSANIVFSLTVVTTTPANTLTVTGDMLASVNATTSARTISGSSLTITNTLATLGNLGIQNYSITHDTLGNMTAMTFQFASSAIGGTATFTMITPFNKTGGVYPSSGSATITGASSTVLRITALGDETAPVGSQVMMELSTDGGATYAAPTYSTWTTITN